MNACYCWCHKTYGHAERCKRPAPCHIGRNVYEKPPIVLPDGFSKPNPKGVSFDGSGGSWREGIGFLTNEA